jgi:hypothetical protein
VVVEPVEVMRIEKVLMLVWEKGDHVNTPEGAAVVTEDQEIPLFGGVYDAMSHADVPVKLDDPGGCSGWGGRIGTVPYECVSLLD